MVSVELVQEGQRVVISTPTSKVIDAVCLQVRDRLGSGSIDHRSLVTSRQEASTEVGFLVVWQTTCVRKHDKLRQLV